MSKEQRVRDALSKGATTKEAAALSGASLQYVYDIKSKINRQNGTTKRRKVHKKIKPEAVPIPKQDVIVKDDLVERLKKEINELTVVIAYLEHRLHQYGAAI